jgi:hypothetical protein
VKPVVISSPDVTFAAKDALTTFSLAVAMMKKRIDASKSSTSQIA